MTGCSEIVAGVVNLLPALYPTQFLTLRGVFVCVYNDRYNLVCQNEIYHKLNFLSIARKVS